MDVIGFSDAEVLSIYQLLSAILNLGNIEFVEYTTSGGIEAVSIAMESGKFPGSLQGFTSTLEELPRYTYRLEMGKI